MSGSTQYANIEGILAQKGAGCFPRIVPLRHFCKKSIAGIH